jgi:hypothetical protein
MCSNILSSHLTLASLSSLMNSNHSLVVLGDPVAVGAGGISIVLAGSGDGVLDSGVIDT